MPRHLVYHAASPRAVQACAYSLLKYLGLYNLKPPAGHHVTVFTNDPAALEAYAPFFAVFELKPLEAHATGLALARGVASRAGNTLFMGAATYPVAPIDPLFEGMDKDLVHSDGLKSASTPLDAFIASYEGLPEFSILLKTFFSKHGEESVPNLVKRAHAIDALRIRADKKAFEALPFFKKIVRKATGRGWQISRYSKKF